MFAEEHHLRSLLPATLPCLLVLDEPVAHIVPTLVRARTLDKRRKDWKEGAREGARYVSRASTQPSPPPLSLNMGVCVFVRVHVAACVCVCVCSHVRFSL